MNSFSYGIDEILLNFIIIITNNNIIVDEIDNKIDTKLVDNQVYYFKQKDNIGFLQFVFKYSTSKIEAKSKSDKFIDDFIYENLNITYRYISRNFTDILKITDEMLDFIKIKDFFMKSCRYFLI